LKTTVAERMSPAVVTAVTAETLFTAGTLGMPNNSKNSNRDASNS
jgi:hypothetical protein